MTHKQFAKNEQSFITWCVRANVKPTARQASKWRMKKGKAWKVKEGVIVMAVE